MPGPDLSKANNSLLCLQPHSTQPRVFFFLPFSCNLELREEIPSVWTRHHLTLFPTMHAPRTGSTQLSEGSQPVGTCSGGRLIFPGSLVVSGTDPAGLGWPLEGMSEE